MKKRIVNISITSRKFTPKEYKLYKAYTVAAIENDDNIQIVIGDDKSTKGWEFVETIYHELTHAYVRMGRKRNISEYDEERLATIVGSTVRGLMMGFVTANKAADFAEKNINKRLKEFARNHK